MKIQRVSHVNILITFLILLCACMLYSEISVFKSLSQLNGKVRYFAMVDDFLVYNQGPQIGTIIPHINIIDENSGQMLSITEDQNRIISLLFVSSTCSKCNNIINNLNDFQLLDNLVIVNVNEDSVNTNHFLSIYSKRMKNILMVHSIPYLIKLEGNMVIDKSTVDTAEDVLTILKEE